MKKLKEYIQLIGDIKLGVYLLFCLSLFLSIGSIYATIYPSIFRQLNNISILSWIKLYNKITPYKTWWLYSLFLCLTLLGINIFICIINRLMFFYRIWQKDLYKIDYKILPTIIHVCFLISLIGHLLSITLIQEKIIKLKNTQLYLDNKIIGIICSKNNYYFTANKKILKQCILKIRLNNKYKTISFLNPIKWKSYTLYLDFNKKKVKNNIIFLLKKDIGAKITLISNMLLTISIVLYFLMLNFSKFKLRRNI